MPERFDVLVIGGGLAGIAAALELQRAGRKVVIIEAGNRLGGKTGSTRTPVGEFPTGPTSFNGRAPAFWKLIELLELEGEAVKLDPLSSARFIARGGKLRGLQPKPLSLLATGALSMGEKLSLLRELVLPKPARVSDDDESLAALLTRRFGASAVEHFFSAVFTGVFAGDLNSLSAQTCLPALVESEKRHGSALKGPLKAMKEHAPGTRAGLFTFKTGFGVIGERAKQLLNARLGSPVTALRVSDAGVEVDVGGETLHGAAAVLATEATAAAQLMPTLAPVLSTFSYAPITLVQWVERTPGESKLPSGFGYLASPAEKLFALGSLFIADLRAETPRRFTTFVGGALQPENASLSDDALAAGAASDLQTLTGGTFGEVVNIVRWKEAVFQPAIGHLQILEKLNAGLTRQPVVLAGSYFGGAAMKDALASGFDAAARVMA